jgi:hypothetical protein
LPRAAVHCDRPCSQPKKAGTVKAGSTSACEVCGGFQVGRALEEMTRACSAAGWARLCVVGGMPGSWHELRRHVEAVITL